MRAEIDGRRIRSETEFHEAISAALPLPSFYGKNFYALRDVLTGMLERPVLLVWKHSDVSKAAFPERFNMIVDVMRETERHDRQLGWEDRFELILE